MLLGRVLCLLGAVTCATGISGCAATHASGDPDGGADAATIGPLDAATFIDLYSRTLCERVVRCAAPAHVNAWWDATPVDCERLFPSRRDELERALSRGRLGFDEAEARACLERIADGCGFNDLSCDRAVLGTAPIGGECASQVECGPAAVCEGSSCAQTCVRAAVEGEPCEPRCALGLACSSDVDGVCVPLQYRSAGEGEACETVRGSTELVITRCDPELYCNETCRPFPPLGAACSPGDWPRCEAGVACVAGPEGYVCTRPVVLRDEGAACDDELLLCDRFNRLICEEGRCVPVGGGVGARCGTPFGDLDCDDGTHCDFPTGTCQPARPDPCAG